jgi:hypothetical protein
LLNVHPLCRSDRQRQRKDSMLLLVFRSPKVKIFQYLNALFTINWFHFSLLFLCLFIIVRGKHFFWSIWDCAHVGVWCAKCPIETPVVTQFEAVKRSHREIKWILNGCYLCALSRILIVFVSIQIESICS